MKPPAHAVSVDLEVPFHDVDALRIVWHGHALKYLELARTALMRARGLDMADLLGLGYGFLMVDLTCRWSTPLRYGDRARVHAWEAGVDTRIRVAYAIDNLTSGLRAVRATSGLVVVDREGRMLREAPDEVRRRLLR